MAISVGESINGTVRNELSITEYERRVSYGVCPVCGDWRIVRIRGGHMKEDPLTGRQRWVSSGYYHTCGSVEDDRYDVQKMHYVLSCPSGKKGSKIYEYLGR